MKFARIIVSIGLWSVLFQWPCAEAAPAPPPPGHWQDTAMDPFLKMADGNNPGDPFPVYWDGVWHLYTMDSGSGSVQHFTSTDLVRWAVHPPAMTGADICTGSVVRHAGKYYLFYTDSRRQSIFLVVSDTPWAFDFHTRRRVAEADGVTYQKGWFRDAFVFYNEQAQLWWMLIEGRSPEVCTGLLTSENLIEWRLCPPIFRDKARQYGSCPQIFRQGARWYLAIQDMGNWYYSADTPNGPWINRGQYLTLVVEAASRLATDGRRQLAWGWLCDWRVKPHHEVKNYGGPLCVGREMVFKEDGSIGVRPLPELIAAIRRHENKADVALIKKIAGQWAIDTDHRVLTCTSDTGGRLRLDFPEDNPNGYFEAEVTFGSPQASAAIVFRASDEADRGYAFVLNPAEKKIAIREGGGEVINDKAYAFPEKDRARVQIFICDNHMEAFVDNQECLSAYTADPTGHKVAIDISGGPAILRDPFFHYFKDKEER